MNKYFTSNTLLLLLFIGVVILIQIISKYKSGDILIRFKKNNIRPSYGDEYYNYYGGDNVNNNENPPDNIGEVIVEGFENDIEAIQRTHRTCPMMEGNITDRVNTIHYPNNRMKGLPGPVDTCFYISTCCDHCFNHIQRSLRENQQNREYDIIYRDNHYHLTKNGEEKQVVFPCSKDGILDLIYEHGNISRP